MNGPTQSLKPEPWMPKTEGAPAPVEDKSKKKALVEHVQGVEAQEAALMPQENKKSAPTVA